MKAPKHLKELKRYRQLIGYMVVTDLKLRYRNSILGFFWTLLNPLLLTAVFWAVFTRIGRMSEKNYALFLLSGMMIWIFFQQSVSSGIGCIVKQKSLYSKIYVPKLVFPLALVTSNLVNAFFFILAYAIFVVFSETVDFTLAALLVVPVLVMTYVMALGGALLFSALNVFFRDLESIIPVLLRAMFYLTPVIYRPSLFGEGGAGNILKLNPMYYPVTLARDALYFGNGGELNDWAVGTAVAVGTLLLGYFVFVKLERKFIFYA